MKPTIGRIVHVPTSSADNVVMAALVTAVRPDDSISATLFPIGAQPIALLNIEHDEAQPWRAGTWHWPPREAS